MKRILSAFIMLFVAFIATAQTTFTGKVVKIKDGDTIVVIDSLNIQHSIRLAGVDAPEKSQEYGTVAKQFVSDAIFGKEIFVKVISKDRYERSIGWVRFNNKNLSEELLKAGLAWHYKEYDKSSFLQNLEDEARLKKNGLWILKNPIPPSQYRKSKILK